MNQKDQMDSNFHKIITWKSLPIFKLITLQIQLIGESRVQSILLKIKDYANHPGHFQLLLLLKDLTLLPQESFFLCQNNNLLIVPKIQKDAMEDGYQMPSIMPN